MFTVASLGEDRKPSGGSRYECLKRSLLVLDLILPLRSGATLQELHRDVCEDVGPVCARTIHRTLKALEEMGLVEKNGSRWVKARNFRSQRFDSLFGEGA